MENNNKEQESTGKTQLERFITFMNNNSLWPKNEIWQIEIDRFLTELKKEPATPPSIEGKQVSDLYKASYNLMLFVSEEGETFNGFRFRQLALELQRAIKNYENNPGKQEIKSKEEAEIDAGLIAQWVINNRYPKSENDKVSDAEMFHVLKENILKHTSQFTPIASKEDMPEFQQAINSMSQKSIDKVDGLLRRENFEDKAKIVWNTCIGEAIRKAKLSVTVLERDQATLIINQLEDLKL